MSDVDAPSPSGSSLAMVLPAGIGRKTRSVSNKRQFFGDVRALSARKIQLSRRQEKKLKRTATMTIITSQKRPWEKVCLKYDEKGKVGRRTDDDNVVLLMIRLVYSKHLQSMIKMI